MDKQTLENLIADQPQEIRAKGVLLFNGAAQAAKAYQSGPTAANLRDWEAAQAALAKFEDQLTARSDLDRPFPSIAEVLAYLDAEGWKVTRASLYRHQKEGKFLPQRDGSFARRDVDRYARVHLKQQSTGKKVSEKMDELQRQKIVKELAALDLELKRKQLAYDKDTERLIPRELVELELAGRAAVLDAGLKHWVQSRSAEWIRTAGGDTARIGELINLMNRELDEHLNGYAAAIEYRVVIEAEEDEPLACDDVTGEMLGIAEEGAG